MCACMMTSQAPWGRCVIACAKSMMVLAVMCTQGQTQLPLHDGECRPWGSAAWSPDLPKTLGFELFLGGRTPRFQAPPTPEGVRTPQP